MQEPTLTVLRDGVPIFTSHGKWLHPLFELEDYLADHPISPEHLVLQEKIIGKAAALLIHRLGFCTVKVGILSRLGEAVLRCHGIAYTYEQLVDRIHCQTEELLAKIEEPEEAYNPEFRQGHSDVLKRLDKSNSYKMFSVCPNKKL
jgi:zinc transport system ATP-binding protein